MTSSRSLASELANPTHTNSFVEDESPPPPPSFSRTLSSTSFLLLIVVVPAGSHPLGPAPDGTPGYDSHLPHLFEDLISGDGVLHGAGAREPFPQLPRMPAVRILGIDGELVEAGEAVDGLPVLEHQECGESAHLQLGHEEGCLPRVDPQDLALDMEGGDDLQVVVQDLAPLELVVEKMDGDPLGRSGALGQEVVLAYGPDLAVTLGQVRSAVALRCPELGRPPRSDGLQLRILLEQVVPLVAGGSVGAIAVRPIVPALPAHHVPSDPIPQVLDPLDLLHSLPLLLVCPGPVGLGPLGMYAVHLPVRRPSGGAVRIVDFVGARGVLGP